LGDYFKQSNLAQASLHGSPFAIDTALRIAINGRFLTQKTWGVQRFAVEAVHAIDALLDADPYRALRGRIEIVAPAQARDFPLRNIPLRRAGFFSGYIWEQVELPLHAAGQLLLNLCMLGPLLTRHQIVVVHDATVRALPDNFSPRFRAAYGFIIPRLCARADLVVTVSEFSRQEIGKWYGADIDKIPICYEGGDHIRAVTADPTALDRFGLRDKKFLLGVGVTSSNKNIETVLAAFQQAKLGDTLLVLTGESSISVHGPLASVQSENVRKVGHVSDADLRTLYEHALALTYPSRYEGFGLPPLEAMNCGCPVIISDQPALVEIAGDAALQCGVDDVAGLAQMMRALHADPALRERLKNAGLERARHFTWRKTACNLLEYSLKVGFRLTVNIVTAAVAASAACQFAQRLCRWRITPADYAPFD
jgi:glycosyltransferase involved in cell wall biosynthesis